MKNRTVITEGLLKLLFPECCPACDEVLGLEEIAGGYCRRCSKKIRRLDEAVCLRCGKKIFTDREYCPDCIRRDHIFDQAKAVYEYTGPMKDAMYRFKYGNRRIYSRTFARDAFSMYSGWIKAISSEMILPVPMYSDKKAHRGYNQAEEFGMRLSEFCGVPIYNDVVVRTVDTPALKKLGARERLNSLKDAFKCTKIFRKKADILLVDDIFTTGATADAVAGVLKNAGAGRVYCLFVCIGAGDYKGGSSYGSQKLQNVQKAFQLSGRSEHLSGVQRRT